ncbi:MAG: bifunctional phosphopantothenoylcysteine decarboxylase/phosphopantothenate--cysteine ligase CoaBC, partial [Candidatus Hydrogenedentes bacterium]|nr:bifunctional phosphopantothenoylcysteine decarboxylase/phosphopantothenate--cysteine ligase CoaBC [Candidatus Hydrogenedentota bacterium]
YYYSGRYQDVIDLATTTLLATRAPLLIAPAMNTNMYQHPATQQNMATLKTRGAVFVGPDSGRLACRTVGPGRLIDPMTILEACVPLLRAEKDLAGKRVVITSGATHEPIDPVRYIGNRSSGKMGRAIALEALARGAEVTVVSGPSEVAIPHNVKLVSIQTATEMAEAVASLMHECDIFVAAAAVGDYRVDAPAASKRKKSGKSLELRLVENPDVLALAGSDRKNGKIIVGFAAETDDLIKNATAKVKQKNLDLIVANQVNTPDSGFGSDTTTAAFVDSKGKVEELPNMSKGDLAEMLMDRVAKLTGAR